jgi:hypothetical protein
MGGSYSIHDSWREGHLPLRGQAYLQTIQKATNNQRHLPGSNSVVVMPAIELCCQKLNVHVEYLYWDEWANVVYDGRIKKKRMVKTSNDIATPNDGSHVTGTFS